MTTRAIVRTRFDFAADLLNMDDGRFEVFEGCRVQHNGARGPWLWSIPCDQPIPAALGSVITNEVNAESIDCRVVVDAANSPVTPISDKIPEDRGIVILPDFLVDVRGVIVSDFERVVTSASRSPKPETARRPQRRARRTKPC